MSPKDENIIFWIRLFEEADPDISLGRLMAMVQEETGADFSEIMKAYEKDARETGATLCT